MCSTSSRVNKKEFARLDLKECLSEFVNQRRSFGKPRVTSDSRTIGSCDKQGDVGHEYHFNRDSNSVHISTFMW